MSQSEPPKTKACLHDRNHGRPCVPATHRDKCDGEQDHCRWCNARHRDHKGPRRRSERTPMPAMRYLVPERRFRRAGLPALQGVERLAKRRSRKPGRISPPLISIGVRAVCLEPYWNTIFGLSRHHSRHNLPIPSQGLSRAAQVDAASPGNTGIATVLALSVHFSDGERNLGA